MCIRDRGYSVQPYSPAAGTGLSSHELNQPGAYRDISDTSVVAQFKSIEEGLPDELINLYPFSSIFFDKHPLQHLHQSNWFYQSISFHSSRRISLHVHYHLSH